jgi:Uma2 family endonuclease
MAKLARMSDPVPARMSADEFIAWAMQQPEGERYELVGGEVVGMAPERAGHARVKHRVCQKLIEAIHAAGAPCEAFPDGLSVRVNADTVYEPDALVRCGPPLNDDTIEVTDPIVVVEVVSPSSVKRDSGSKLEGYFRLSSVRHYLIVTMRNRAIIHHHRGDAGTITTHIIRDGTVRLDPAGIELIGLF